MLTMTLLVAAANVCLCAERAENRDERFVMPAAMTGVEERFGELVAMRATAIDQALGPILAGACTRITIDLREAAHRKGVSWPHQECASVAIEKRLGCEMLVSGVSASRRPPQIFNANRIDLLWPDTLDELRARGWRKQDGAVSRAGQTSVVGGCDQLTGGS